VSYFGRLQHTGQNICLQLEDFMKELGLDSEKIKKYIVLDNASNNVKAMELTKMFEAIPCSIHTLQLAVCDSFKATIQLKKVSDVLKKNNKLVNFVRRSEARLNELRDACKAVNIQFLVPVKPNDTRWNSEFSSLLTTILLNRGYKYLAFNDNSKKKIWLEHVLNNDEMSIVVAVKNALEPVKNASKLWEGDLVPTSHLVVRELFNIRDQLSVQSKDADEYVAEFASDLAAQVEKRFPNCGTTVPLHSCAHFLDPEYKGMVLSEFPGVYENTMGFLREMASKYVKDDQNATSPTDGTIVEVQDAVVDESSLSGVEKLKRRKLSVGGWAAGPPLSIDVEIKNYEQMDLSTETLPDNPLIFWKDHSTTFKLLSQCAKEVFSVPASSASSERVFSVGGNVCTTKRSSLSPNKISELMLLNIAMKDVERYKAEHTIPKAYSGKKVNNLVQVKYVDKSMEEVVRDEFMEEIVGEMDLSDSDKSFDGSEGEEESEVEMVMEVDN